MIRASVSIIALLFITAVSTIFFFPILDSVLNDVIDDLPNDQRLEQYRSLAIFVLNNWFWIIIITLIIVFLIYVTTYNYRDF